MRPREIGVRRASDLHAKVISAVSPAQFCGIIFGVKGGGGGGGEAKRSVSARFAFSEAPFDPAARQNHEVIPALWVAIKFQRVTTLKDPK